MRQNTAERLIDFVNNVKQLGENVTGSLRESATSLLVTTKLVFTKFAQKLLRQYGSHHAIDVCQRTSILRRQMTLRSLLGERLAINSIATNILQLLEFSSAF